MQAKNGGILLANVFQSSRSTFSWGSSPAFFAFKEGMWVTRISALGGSPTVSGGFSRQQQQPELLMDYYEVEKWIRR
jgi:hypothetical protein